jgi:hypothetical protein
MLLFCMDQTWYNLVNVFTFSEKVCIEFHELAQAQTGLSITYPIDDNMIEGVKLCCKFRPNAEK